MPIHEFKCKKCEKVFEYLCMRNDDKANAVCPACGHNKTETQLSTFSSTGTGSEAGALSSCASPGRFS